MNNVTQYIVEFQAASGSWIRVVDQTYAPTSFSEMSDAAEALRMVAAANGHPISRYRVRDVVSPTHADADAALVAYRRALRSQ